MHCINWMLALFFLNNSITRSCCERPNKKLDKKWEALREPLLRKRAIQLTQKQMLNVLGFDEFPSHNHRVLRPHTFMLDLYNTLSRGAKRWKSKQPARGIINTVRGVVDQEIYDRSLPQEHNQLYVFTSSSMQQKDHIVSSELRILRKPLQNNDELISEYGTTFKAVIHMKRRIPFSLNHIPYTQPGLEPLDSFTFDITDSEERWNVLTVTRAVQRWQRSPSKVHYLQLTIQSVLNGKFVSPDKLGFSKEKRRYRNRALLVVFSNDEKEETHTQKSKIKTKEDKISHWMEVAYTDNEPEQETHARVKRGARRRRKKYQCRVKPLPVDFEKLDWGNWVIAPHGYDAGICEGACKFPLEVHLRPTNHATIQTILNNVDPLAVPPVCCVPNKLSPLSILYTSPGGEILYKKYKNMVVSRCGCS